MARGTRVVMAPRVQLSWKKPAIGRRSPAGNCRKIPRTLRRGGELMVLVQIIIETPAGPAPGMVFRPINTELYVREFCRLNGLIYTGPTSGN